MSTHLAHRLQWASLGEVITATRPNPHPNDPSSYWAKRNSGRQEPTRKQLRVVYHFAKCLSAAVKEFAESDRSSQDERDEYDPVRSWGDYDTSRGAAVGYYNSLIEGYIELNLILSDPEVFTPLVTGENQRWSEAMRVMCDNGDGGHGQWLANFIRPAFVQNGRVNTIKPPTAEVLQLLRDHSARLFRCLYSISGINRIHDVDFVTGMIVRRFRISRNLRFYWTRDSDLPLADWLTSPEEGSEKIY